MPNNFIYVVEEGAHDYSRWLNISLRPNGLVTFHLTDLCHPGMLSALTAVSCEIGLAQASLANGALQITLGNGYFLAQRDGDALNIEFRSYEETNPCKVMLRADEVNARLEALQTQALARR
jgi:hypothetical protein